MQDDGEKVNNEVCPEGLDYRQLRVYVRCSEEEDGVPPAVMAHIEECSVCHPKWKFLLRTDPVVRKQFEVRVLSLVEQVTVQGIIFKPLRAAGAAAGVAGQIAGVLGAPAPRAAVESILREPGMDRILDEKADLHPKFVVDAFERVHSIPDKKERQLKGQAVTALFGQRLEKKQVSQQTVYEVLFKLSSIPGKEALPETELEVAATIPETATAVDPPLLTWVGEQAMFNAPELRRLRGTPAVWR